MMTWGCWVMNTNISTEMIKKWIKDAENATPGNWFHEPCSNVVLTDAESPFPYKSPALGNYGHNEIDHSVQNAIHIANSCPHNFLILCHEILELRKENRQ